MIGKARRVNVLDSLVRLQMQQPVEHAGGVAHADVHDLGVERRVPVRNMRVEIPLWAAAVFRIDAAGAEVLAIQ